MIVLHPASVIDWCAPRRPARASDARRPGASIRPPSLPSYIPPFADLPPLLFDWANEAGDRSEHVSQWCDVPRALLSCTGDHIEFWYPKMPKVHVRKTSREQSDLSRYKDAYEEFKVGDLLRKAADKHRIYHCSVLRYLRKRHALSHYIQRTDPETSGFIAP
ncbi:hypothetical protein EVAR_39603_1 [Eumeta japonica]|uniref:Uncharacterized protein n=1 Tax=Eumeta variegata TaxID=151549 RepID=A0A4C1Y3A2_EUMVA|nr:hypothetical protein EVAR_39603_1 [Eumeta japonica]